MSSTSELLDLAIELAHQAGALLRQQLGTARLAGTKSSSTDAVTEADRASEALILEGLRQARPGDAVLAEEGGDVEGHTGLLWVVDPLDGTVNYLYGHPSGWSVSIAVEDEAGPLVGVVFDPPRNETFTAARGEGAARDGQPIAVSSPPNLSQALIGTGFSYDPERRRAQAEQLVDLVPRVRDIRRAGSAALDLAWTACGRLDGFYEATLGHWDWAAGSLIVTEAGGRFARRDDNLVVAASPAVFADLQALLAP